jgi:hypothetical protein
MTTLVADTQDVEGGHHHLLSGVHGGADPSQLAHAFIATQQQVGLIVPAFLIPYGGR